MIHEQIVEMIDVGLVVLDSELQVRHWNRWLEVHSGISAEKIIGKTITEIFPNLDIPKFHRNVKAVLKLGNFSFFSQKAHNYLIPCKPVSSFDKGLQEMQQNCTMGPLRDDEGRIQYVYISVHDVSEVVAYERSLEEALAKAHELTKDLEDKRAVLEESHRELKAAQSQILQQEKMASIGQLAAGVAHEINNPMGFIYSNLGSLKKYTRKLCDFINMQTDLINASESADELRDIRKKMKIDFVLEDTEDLIVESLEGADRVKEIVLNLKNFSRVDQAKQVTANINDCLENTLKIIWNELKYKAAVHKEYGDLPGTKCFPMELNQVFMNILVNAAQAIEEKGEITIMTSHENDRINVVISDTGCGIPPDKINRIFEPFFTTKKVGEGTGLGMSIAYDIIKKHEGNLYVTSEVGRGTSFAISLPVVGE